MKLKRRPFFSRLWLSYRGWRQAGFGRGLAASTALSMATRPSLHISTFSKSVPHRIGRCIDGPCHGREISASADVVYVPLFRGGLREHVYQWDDDWRGIGGWRSLEVEIVNDQERAS